MTPIRSRRSRLAGPLALMAGLVVAHAVIYLSTGWRDGYANPALWGLKRHFFRYLPQTLVLATVVGWMLEAFHGRWLDKDPNRPLRGWPVLLAALRTFLHFPFYGFIVLFQFTYLLACGIGKALLSKARTAPAQVPAPGPGFMDSTALWMLLGPFSGMTDAEGQTLRLGLRPSDLAVRAPRLFPWLLLILWIWTGAESEESGERVNAFGLSLAGMVWLGDFFLLAWMNRPAWLRRGLG